MELDQLRNILSQLADCEIVKPNGINLENGRAYDAFAEVKKRCLWILRIFAATTAIFFPFLLSHRNFLFKILYLILSVESVISSIGYLQIRNLEQASGNIKQDLVARIRRLNSIFRSYIFLNALFYMLLALVLEYMIHDHIISGFGFENISFPIRLLIYLVFIFFQYLQKRWSYKKNYGSYLSSMIQLLNQTNE